jgi:hypothetical protein
LTVNAATVVYEESTPGHYAPPPDHSRLLQVGDEFGLHVQWEGMLATVAGVIPPPIRFDSIAVDVPSMPVEAVLIDSLRLDTLGVDATTGYIYPVETTAWWTPGSMESFESWIHAQLRPQSDFSSVVVDFFLLPEDVFRESDAEGSTSGPLSWTGLYAIPVDRPEHPLPSHMLRVAIVRSNEAYADYTIGRFDENGQEPPSNIEGALGIAAGVSVDSIQVQLDRNMVGRRTVVFRR